MNLDATPNSVRALTYRPRFRRIIGLLALVTVVLIAGCTALPPESTEQIVPTDSQEGSEAASNPESPPSSPFMTSEEAGVSFKTIPSIRPEGSTCLNQERGEKDGKAKELMNIQTLLVVIGFGDTAMPNSEWSDYQPSLPWAKNIDRLMTVDSSCIYRSPTAPEDCEGAECRDTQEVAGYEWVELAIVHSQDCLPTADAGCTATEIPPGALDVKVMSKCHVLVWEDEIYELVDPAGNRYVMQATEIGTPDLNATLPEGWTLTLVTLEEPLTVPPVGGGDNCYHNVLRDHLGQTYHQYVFVDDQYPSPQN